MFRINYNVFTVIHLHHKTSSSFSVDKAQQHSIVVGKYKHKEQILFTNIT